MSTNPVSVKKLRTEYLENPLGIDALKPALGWQIVASERNVTQSAYQVQVSQSTDELAQEKGLLWDSGKVLSDAISTQYAGAETHSRQRYFWRVRVWDQHDQPSEWSELAWWEMGLLEEKDWSAEWIEPGWDEDSQVSNPCPYFRRNFTLDSPVKSARLYITAHGLYEAWLNDQRIGDQVFTPGYTPYDKMLQYQVYDVTKMVNQGENAVGAILGDGWYRGKIYISDSGNVYGTRLALLAQLQIETMDGQELVIATDSNWNAATGPILKSGLKEGEIYDARLEMPGWCSAGFDAQTWQGVRTVKHPKDVLVASMGVPVRRKETFRPTVLKTPNGETVLDFGQNLAGVVHFKVRGPRGTIIRLRHGESLDKDGNFTVTHLFARGVPDLDKNPFQEVRYTLKGDGMEEYEPRFTVHGFRYVKVEGYPGEINPDDFYSVAIYSEMPPTGTFECSDTLITQLHQNTEWSMKSNFLDLPTDCPQRERAGWTGDAQIFTPSASFLMDTRTFFRKWLRELTLEQFPSGMVGNFVPNPYRLTQEGFAGVLVKLDGSSGWGDVATMMPWALYQAFGDIQFLESQYESMKAWVDYLQKRARRKNWSKNFNPGIILNRERRARQRFIWDTNYHWGEWLEPGEDLGSNMAVGVIKRVLLGAPVVATAYFAHSARILAQAAELLGRVDDAQTYHALADQVKDAYIAEFIGKDGRITPDKQASYARVLAFDLAPTELKPAIVEHLVRLIRATDNHIGTGFLSTVFLCHVLAENGRLDVAYELLTQKTSPSWLYAITKGATTIWETWDGIKPDGTPNASLNHYSPGAVINFLHRKVAGIEAAKPGYKRIRIHPMPGGGLTSAKATYESVNGLIISEWETENGKMRMNVTIPANTRATIILPGAVVNAVTETGAPLAKAEAISNVVQAGMDTALEAGSGSYRFEYPLHHGG